MGRLDDIKTEIGKDYPHFVEPLLASISLATMLSFRDQTQPVTLILVGQASTGKTSVVEMMRPNKEHEAGIEKTGNDNVLNEKLDAHIYPLSSFTKASMLSQAANVSPAKLKKIHLLPKLKNKVLLTKELAPLFQTPKKELTPIFGDLTDILDGKGLEKAGGVHETVRIKGPLVFNWIGCTTPITAETHDLMSTLGGRIIWYHMPKLPISKLEGRNIVKNRGKFHKDMNRFQGMVNEFLMDHFERHPKRTVHMDTIKIPDEIADYIWSCAQFTACMRAMLPKNPDATKGSGIDEFLEAIDEAGYRLAEMYSSIACSLALMHDRNVVNESDLKIIRHICLSSMHEQRRKLTSIFLEGKNPQDRLSIPDLREHTAKFNNGKRWSLPSIKYYARHLNYLGPWKYKDGEGGYLALKDEYHLLLNNQPVNTQPEVKLPSLPTSKNFKPIPIPDWYASPDWMTERRVM